MANSSTKYAYLTKIEMQILRQCPYQLTLSIDELTTSAVKKHLNFENPPRPQNSWIIFRKDYEATLRRRRSPDVKQEVKHTAQECSLKWRQLSSEVKHFFKILEKIACENHKRIYPNYKYKPKNAKNSNCKKFVFREQKKYPVSSLSPSLTNKVMDDTTSIRADIVSTNIDTLPSMINVNSSILPPTINDDAALLINTEESNNDIDIDILKIIANYYVLDDMNDLNNHMT
ncbi:12834_t:CDS:1 [Ambispora gerdemannii]|uniref:12834_t:CDS:1 n=1 Tax=Ambispora gerdemannii TaxID=144530 RepID=A0A9N8YW97_9GLOM|nr:12834_t:CDS:1 [Ambispora gerdemannii]